LEKPTPEEESDEEAITPCFVAVSAADQAVGYLVCHDENNNSSSCSAFVHPAYRRRGLFRRLWFAARDFFSSGHLLSFEICCQSLSGITCASCLCFRRQDSLDWYLVCLRLAPATRPLPNISLTFGDKAFADDVFRLWELEYPSSDAEEAAQMRASILKDLSTREKCFVLRETASGPAVGSITAVLDGPEAYFMNVIVAPALRGRGLGEAMLREAVRMCLQDMGKERVTLETTKVPAARLYERVGFEVRLSWSEWQAPCLGL